VDRPDDDGGGDQQHDHATTSTRREPTMPARAKSILMWIVVIFLLYAVVTNPDRAAEVVENIWDFIYGAFSGFAQFFSNLAD